LLFKYIRQSLTNNNCTKAWSRTSYKCNHCSIVHCVHDHILQH